MTYLRQGGAPGPAAASASVVAVIGPDGRQLPACGGQLPACRTAGPGGGGGGQNIMISSEFAEKLSHFPNLKKKFGGIFSADTLPIKLKPKSFIICNTDVEKGPGKHWYCVVKLNTSVLECFDSLGIDSEKKLFHILSKYIFFVFGHE